MANYFSKYQGRGGPAIAPGIVQMMGSIGDEYAKGITALGEGVAKYQKNKAEKNKAETDFENALSRMGSLYGEEPGDYQQVLNAVDSKTMQKIQDGKGTKEDFLSALNSLNTVGELIEDRREDAESARRFDITTDQRERQIKATTALGWGGISSREDIAAADRESREGMQTKDISFRKDEGAADRTSRKELQQAQITSTEKMHGAGLAQDKDQFMKKLGQDFFLEMGRQDLTDKEREPRYQIHTESAEQAWNLAQDTLAQKDRHHAAALAETKRMGDLKVNAAEAERDREAASAQALSTFLDKSQTVHDPDAMAAALKTTPTDKDPWGGMTSERLQGYLDNPEQFQRPMTVSERAIEALQTPNLSQGAQENIAKWANAEAGTGGIKFVKHEASGNWMSVGPTGTTTLLGKGGKSATEIRVDYERERDRIRAMENKQDAILEARKARLTSLQKLLADPIVDEDDPVYKKADADWNDLITELGGGEKIPEYGRDGKRKN